MFDIGWFMFGCWQLDHFCRYWCRGDSAAGGMCKWEWLFIYNGMAH